MCVNILRKWEYLCQHYLCFKGRCKKNNTKSTYSVLTTGSYFSLFPQQTLTSYLILMAISKKDIWKWLSEHNDGQSGLVYAKLCVWRYINYHYEGKSVCHIWSPIIKYRALKHALISMKLKVD